MHPAPSIIVFTTLSGLGYGLAAMLGLGLFDPALVATKVAHVLALAMIAGGLMSSTLHLGNPQRAWRALSQWRSSWLSREGVMAVITFVPLVASAWFCLLEGRYVSAIGLAGTALSAVTVYCTGMIYASLKSIDAWHTPLTPTCYLLFAGAGGALLALFFATIGGSGVAASGGVALVFLVLSWAAKWKWWQRQSGLQPRSTPASATGLGAIGKVRLFERPHMTENYLTREMGFKVARKHADKLRRIAVIVGGALPFVASLGAIAASGGTASALSALAVLGYAGGVLVERWLFFAEARHAVMNYYGS